MTGCQIYTRLVHALTAVHWRGYAVHSPMMYAFVREVVIGTRRRDLVAAIVARYGDGRVLIADSVEELLAVLVSDRDRVAAAVLREPFRSRAERREWEAWYAQNHVVVAHFQGVLVLFLDPKLQKQRFKIRN